MMCSKLYCQNTASEGYPHKGPCVDVSSALNTFSSGLSTHAQVEITAVLTQIKSNVLSLTPALPLSLPFSLHLSLSLVDQHVNMLIAKPRLPGAEQISDSCALHL